LLLLSLCPALTLSSGASGAGAAAVGAAAFGIFAAATAALAVLAVLSATAAPGREGALVAPLVAAVFGLLLPFGTAVALSDAFAVAFEPIVASRI